MLVPMSKGFRSEPNRKEFWLQAFSAALHRVGAAEAVLEADEALRLCDERWRNPAIVGSVNYEHDYPVGHVFAKGHPTV